MDFVFPKTLSPGSHLDLCFAFDGGSKLFGGYDSFSLVRSNYRDSRDSGCDKYKKKKLNMWFRIKCGLLTSKF